MTSIKPRLLTVKEAQQRSSLSAWEIRRLCDAGILRRRYVGKGTRFYRIELDSLDEYIDSLPTEAVAR